MTYCLAISVNAGLIFASDSRTNAGPDHVATYGKMHTFGVPGERQIVVLTAGNLATTQAAITQMKRDIQTQAATNLRTVATVAEAADYLGSITRAIEARYGPAVVQAGFSAEASYILGGQIGMSAPRLYLVYPQGNYISTSEQTPFLQIGEAKYGKPILERIVGLNTDLDEAARCALVSMDSTIRSNATVGPPIEVLCYRRDSLVLSGYLRLSAEDPYLLELKRTWDERLQQAFREMPHFTWGGIPASQRFE